MIMLIGNKIGMTRFFLSDGLSIPITVIKIEDNRIVLIKKNKLNNYVQVTIGNKKKKKINKSILGIYKKYNVIPGINLWSIPYIKGIHLKVGQKLTIKLFSNIKKVDVTGLTKGKGFAGTIKRWNFKSQDSSHGNSLSHRAPGSIGQNQTPGRVFKGKKMSGHMGYRNITVQNLNIINLDFNKNLLLLKGCVPGFNNNIVLIKSSIKN